MPKLKYKYWLNLLVIFLLSGCFNFTPIRKNPGGNSPPNISNNCPDNIFEIGVPDPIDAHGDCLYEINRKGLITRHITNYGQLINKLALLNVDVKSKGFWDRSKKYIQVKYPTGIKYKIPTVASRYSVEYTNKNKDKKSILWVPMIAPLKNPGDPASGFYAVSQSGDNPMYKAGPVIAAFSLEYLHKVSPHSIKYARRMIEYMYYEQLPYETGYITRRERVFNSGMNIVGENLFRGQSGEELIGSVIGLMFFLKAETKGSYHYDLANKLLSKLLSNIPSLLTSRYKHDFFSKTKDSGYQLSHFKFPLLLSDDGSNLCPALDSERCFGYKNFTNSRAGSVSSKAIWICETLGICQIKYWQQIIYSWAIMIAFESDVGAKKEIAMDHINFILKDLRKSKFGEKSRNDAVVSIAYYWARQIIGDTAFSEYFIKAFPIGDPDRNIAQSYSRQLMTNAEYYGTLRQPNYNNTRVKEWQHNLPFYNQPRKLEASGYWVNHILDKNIKEGVRNEYRWTMAFPGNLAINGGKENKTRWSFGYIGDKETYSDFINSSDDQYQVGSFKNEFCMKVNGDFKCDVDLQVEESAYKSLFFRMIMAHINPDKFKFPALKKPNNNYPVLPYPGITSILPKYLYPSGRIKSSQLSKRFQVFGDTSSLDSIFIDKFGGKFITASIAKNDNLRFNAWTIKPVTEPTGTIENLKPVKISELSRLNTNSKVAAVKLVKTANGFFTVERAKKSSKYWLRVRKWAYSNSRKTFLLKNSWNSRVSSSNSVRSLDADAINKNIANQQLAVIFKSKSKINRLQVFNIDSAGRISNAFTEAINVQEGMPKNDEEVKITTYKNKIFYAVNSKSGFYIREKIWRNGISSGVKTKFLQGEILDLNVIFANDKTYLLTLSVKKDNQHAGHNNYLVVDSWELPDNGGVVYKGNFSTRHGFSNRVTPEYNYLYAEIQPLNLKGSRDGFIIVGAGASITNVEAEKQKWKTGERALKVLWGTIRRDGVATIESFNVAGKGGFDNPGAISGNICAGLVCGAVTSHQSNKNEMINIFWQYNDPYINSRWSRASSSSPVDPVPPPEPKPPCPGGRCCEPDGRGGCFLCIPYDNRCP